MMIVRGRGTKLGDKIVVRPGVGTCRYTGDGGGSDMVFGAAAAMQVWKDAAGKITANVQVGAELLSSDGGSAAEHPYRRSSRVQDLRNDEPLRRRLVESV